MTALGGIIGSTFSQSTSELINRTAFISVNYTEKPFLWRLNIAFREDYSV